MAYRMVFRKSAEREFAKLDQELKRSIIERLESLAKDPYKATNVKKVLGFRNGYRLRLGRWRIFYLVWDNEKEIEVIDIFMEKGKEDYRRLHGFRL
jgi:mRNA interferase RelE/StbE